MTRISFLRLSAVVSGVWLLSTVSAHAYVDPGSTSYLFQLLIGGLTAVAFFFGSIRRRAKAGWQWLCRRGENVPKQSALPPEQTTTKDA